MKAFAEAVYAIHNVDSRRELLIWTAESGALQRIAQNRALQPVAQICPLIKETAQAVLVLSNCRPASEERVIVVCERLCMLWHKELRPVHYLVVQTRVKRISSE